MITKEKKVYYCEHCKKHGMSVYHMQRHETGCTLNPRRVCNWCKVQTVKGLAEVTAYLREQKDEQDKHTNYNVTRVYADQVIAKAHNLLEKCPICVLAAIRQSKNPYLIGVYNYKDKITEWRKNEQSEYTSTLGGFYL